MGSLVVTKPSQSRCREPQSTLGDLIDEWLPKLAINAGAALDAKTQAVYRAIWLEGLGDLSPEVLRAAFQKTLRECAYWPVKVADVRKHVSSVETNAANRAAEESWDRVLELRCRYWCPDMPGGFSRGMPKLSERVQQACRAAGVFRDYESADQLHIWSKKTFIESFISWGELQRDKFLLPDGEIKRLLADAARPKALPAPEVSFQDLHKRGLEYKPNESKLSPEERLRRADELADAARKVIAASEPKPYTVSASDAVRKALRHQAELVKAKYPVSAAPEELRKYILEPAPSIAQRAEDATP